LKRNLNTLTHKTNTLYYSGIIIYQVYFGKGTSNMIGNRDEKHIHINDIKKGT